MNLVDLFYLPTNFLDYLSSEDIYVLSITCKELYSLLKSLLRNRKSEYIENVIIPQQPVYIYFKYTWFSQCIGVPAAYVGYYSFDYEESKLLPTPPWETLDAKQDIQNNRKFWEFSFMSDDCPSNIKEQLARLFYNHNEVILTILDEGFWLDNYYIFKYQLIRARSQSRNSSDTDDIDMLLHQYTPDLSRTIQKHSFDITVPIYRGLYRTTSKDGLTIYRLLPQISNEEDQLDYEQSE